ncbi:NADH dehydrogenase [ubiquinone] 1 alpha subcomplex subunit 11 [Euwallacea fornicatus]|uniref:NADH dehydrogenase [ubiquinone] 1 alpha subcomplex subunit 11 n=1 Tax=Euwallacea fornicatus TaxID=995702 RepID=UPI00338E9FA6
MPPQVALREKGFEYNSTPDGEEVFAKMKYTLKYASALAAFVGIFDYHLVPRSSKILDNVFRFGAVSLPVIGGASTFVLVTNGLGSLRKKDDQLNWFVGGFATGSLLGMIKRNRMLGFNVGMFGGIMAMICKEIILSKWELSPSNPKRMVGTGRACLWDFSLVKERPRNWTTGPVSS